MSKLFTPVTVGGVEFANRAWVSPMCQYSAIDGHFNQWHQVHYGAFCTGGAGLVMVEATAVVPEGRISVGCLGIWSDTHAEELRFVPEFAHAHGTKAGIQLAHAGRKGSTTQPWSGGTSATAEQGGWQTVAPSAIAFGPYDVPRAMTHVDIATVKHAFVDAAIRAVNAGFDVIEVHSAHGYLLHEFLSPLTNDRTDEYGGSFENRTRLLREVVAEVRAVVPDDRAMFVRLSATDWVEGGWDVDQTVELSRQLRMLGVDLVDVSSGGLVPDAVIPAAPAYQVPFARRVATEAGIAASAVGMITSGKQAEDLLANGELTAVMIGRAMLGNPRWPIQAAADLGVTIPWPVQYLRGVVS